MYYKISTHPLLLDREVIPILLVVSHAYVESFLYSLVSSHCFRAIPQGRAELRGPRVDVDPERIKTLGSGPTRGSRLTVREGFPHSLSSLPLSK